MRRYTLLYYTREGISEYEVKRINGGDGRGRFFSRWGKLFY